MVIRTIKNLLHMDMSKIDLNAPAFGEGAQILEEPTVEAVAEPVVEAKGETEPSEEESKVPYSRFKKFHDEALQYKKEAEEWRMKAEAKSETPEPEELPTHWVKLYGDSDASKEAWKIQQEANEELREKLREEALDAVRNERFEEAQRTEKNIEVIDSQFEDLSAKVGRDLTDKEQSSVLDIVDEFTQKDADGNYTGNILPIEKAWDIYNLKQQAEKAPKQKARDEVAALSGSQSLGETSTEQDKNFNPLDWNAWKKRI